MPVFVDTSALLALLATEDKNHVRARVAWDGLLEAKDDLVCSSYVLLETYALLQNRLGMDPVRTLGSDTYPVLKVTWVEKGIHEAAVAALLGANRRRLSLVDCVSFEVMRRLGIRRVFAFDVHFEEQGFEVVPAPMSAGQ